MPILWRYLLKNYLRTFLLCMCAFIGILLVTRMQDIASFAALGTKLSSICLFTLYQIPYILPISIPISALISSILFFRKISQTHELSALRMGGLSLKAISSPLLIVAVFLSLGNFLIVSELTPYCRFLSHQLLFETIRINPLLLMKKSRFMSLSESYVDMRMQQLGKEAKDVIFVMNNHSNEQLHLLLAKELSLSENQLSGKDIAIISNPPSGDPYTFDHLMIENQGEMTVKASSLTNIMQKTNFNIGYEHLPLKHLLMRSFFNQTVKPKTIKRLQFEVGRRLFFPLATLMFTLIGISFGLQISREKKLKNLFWAISLAAFSFICFLIGRSFELNPIKAWFFFLIPHPIVAIFSYRFQRRISRGVE